MTAVNQNIGTKPADPFIAGDDRVLVFTVDADLTGASIRWEAFAWPLGPNERYGPPDTEPVIVKVTGGSEIAITDVGEEESTFAVTLVPADTATLTGMHWHEAQVVVGGKTHTVATGQFLISRQRVV